MNARALVVSIHDVSPLTQGAVGEMLGLLAGAGIPRVSLLVIPDHHHRGNITADAAFGAWLRERVAEGHEPVLHGYFHQRETASGESLRTRLFTRHYTTGEGEFFDIPFKAACSLLARGADELASVAGVAPTGFIAPAWLLSPDAEAAARNLGFAYITRLGSVCALGDGRVHRSQSLCWSVRTAARRAVSLAWNPLLFASLRSNPLLRISIHPPDRGHPAVWRQVDRLVRRAARDREPVSYGEFVARWMPQKAGVSNSPASD